jgi:hypothetical protein
MRVIFVYCVSPFCIPGVIGFICVLKTADRIFSWNGVVFEFMYITINVCTGRSLHIGTACKTGC